MVHKDYLIGRPVRRKNKVARYLGPREKIERRIGEKLFLKGERSKSQKSAMVKKPYPPGMHGKRFHGKLSEYGQQLTANISKLGLSGLRKVCTFNQNFNGLTGWSFEIPAYSYWQTVSSHKK